MRERRNPFTDEELAAAAGVELTLPVLLHAQRIGTAALNHFASTVMEPVIRDQVAISDRELAISLTFYRLVAATRTLADLNRGYQFQAMASSTRLILELSIDIELLTQSLIARPERLFHAFTRAARFGSAWKLVAFYRDHPELTYPDDADEQRQLVGEPEREAEIVALCQETWGRRHAPEHWSGLRWSEQAELVSGVLQQQFVRWQALFAWQVHGGGAGVAGLSEQSIQGIEMICRDAVKAVVPPALRRVGVSMHMHRAIENFFDELDFAARVAEVYASVDARLQLLGRASRFE